MYVALYKPVQCPRILATPSFIPEVFCLITYVCATVFINDRKCEVTAYTVLAYSY